MEEKMFSESMDVGTASSPDLSIPNLRVDVYPIAEELLPQSFLLDESDDLYNLRFDLADTVTLSGYVHGTTVFPHSDGVTVPSSRAAISAQIQLSIPNALNGNIVNTTEEGWFEVDVPANDSYQFSVTPITPTDLPFEITEDFFLRESQDLEIELDLGIPVYGHVNNLSNTEEASLQLIDKETGIKGPKVSIAEDGHFLLRAPEDRSSLILRLEGTPGSVIPTIEVPFINDNSDGIELQINIGELNPISIRGSVLSRDGAVFSDRATIRFESKELLSNIGQLIVETSNDGNGIFNTRLLPGSWIAHFIPPYDDSANAAPVSIEFEITEEDSFIMMEDTYLMEDVRIFTRIIDSMGQPAPNVLVSFQETSFNHEIYTGFTDSDGRLDIRVPSGDLNVTLTPTANSVDAITKATLLNPQEGEEVQWTLQAGESIRGSFYHRNIPVSHALIELWEGEVLLSSRSLNEAGSFEIKLQVD